MAPLLSVIIPTRNRKALLLETLRRLGEQRIDPAAFEVVVVADGCTDGTAEAVEGLAGTREWAGKSVRCIEQGWSGAAAARNRGLRAAGGDLVLFLDDDVQAAPNLLEAHIARHAESPERERVVLGRIVPEEGKGALHAQLENWWHEHYRRLANAKPTFAAFYTGNASLVRRAAVEVGGLDEGLDYGEDIEFGYRLSGAGQEFVYAPEAAVRTRNPKGASALLRDFSRSGAGAVHIYHKSPAALRGLPLSAYGETSLRMRLARGVLLALSRNQPTARLIDRLFTLWAGSRGFAALDRQLFELALSYYYWLGVRDAVSDRKEWARLSSPGVPVITYHSVPRRARGNIDLYAVDRARFDRQMKMLKWLGYRVVPLERLAEAWAAGRLPPPRAAAIAFDDGYTDNMTEAWPVLRRLGWPATLFLVTGRAGETSAWDAGVGAGPRALLGWDELRRLDREGFRIESHTVTHPHLTRVSPEEVEYEVGESRRQLEDALGRPVRLFAYPYGHEDERVQEQVEGAGYLAAFSVRGGLNGAHTERFALKRIIVSRDDSLLSFALKVWLGEDPFKYVRRITRSGGGRGR